jgi:alpha-mannosidase
MKRVLFLSSSIILCTLLGLMDAVEQTPVDPYKAVLDRLESIVVQPLDGVRYHTDMAHPEEVQLNDSNWSTVKVDERWSNGPRVLRRTIEIPAKLNGYSTQGARVKLDLMLVSDGPLVISVFSNGGLVYHGTDTTQQPIPLTASAQPGQTFVVAVRVDARNVPTRILRCQLLFDPPPDRPSPILFREELLAVQPIVAAYAEGKAEREQQLDAAVKAVEFGALDRGDQAGFDASLRQAQAKLEVLNPWIKRFTIRAVGNSHIDMAWLWPWTETVEVVRDTFRSVLDLMREYPDFKFTMSSARTYEWMEEKYPDLFHEIERRVKEGRWEIVGGMWVEPDLNMPAGESLTRQILIGKRYLRDKFGVDTKIGWNPDSFGYNAQLPQIYKKSGMDYFVTQKLLWAHEFTTFPYKMFWWEAPDGSRLLTYFPHDYAGGIDAPALGKDVSVWAPAIYGPQLKEKPLTMHLFGVGDHGGGPTRAMLDNAVRLQQPNAVFPNLPFSTATDFFDDISKRLSTLQVPVWKDELYFQYHRGVFTTQAETKRRIRRTEETLLNAEKFSSLAFLYGRPYPQYDMQRAWKGLLFDHFHDIMPGSGIAVNYLDAKRDLEDVRRMGRDMINGSLGEIAARVNTQGEGVPVLVFNSLSWARTEPVEIEAQLPAAAQGVQVVDSKGKGAHAQLLSMDADTHRARILLLANTPGTGYSTYFVRPATSATPADASAVKATENSLENEFARLKLDTASGCVTSLFDKRSQTEALAPSETDTGGPTNSVCGNLLQTFVDKPKEWDAWNIDADFEKKHWDLDKADEVKLVENTPLRAVIRVKKHFQDSTFTQDITMYAGVPRVDVKMHASWHEKHILLKVAFPVSAHSSKATYEIPYGSIERPTTRNTPAEQAQFEVPALQWADISDAQHGFSLLNDCKYGYDAKGNVLRLSLLRSPEWPDPHADEGEHDFIYSMYPHGGGWREAQTVRRGYELNYRLLAEQTEKHQGTLPAENSFVRVEPENVVLTAMKKAEDDGGLVLRFYEWAGKATDVVLAVPAGAKSASETNLMETRIGDLSLADGRVTVSTKPYEIKTLKIDYGLTRQITQQKLP